MESQAVSVAGVAASDEDGLVLQLGRAGQVEPAPQEPGQRKEEQDGEGGEREEEV